MGDNAKVLNYQSEYKSSFLFICSFFGQIAHNAGDSVFRCVHKSMNHHVFQLVG